MHAGAATELKQGTSYPSKPRQQFWRKSFIVQAVREAMKSSIANIALKHRRKKGGRDSIHFLEILQSPSSATMQTLPRRDASNDLHLLAEQTKSMEDVLAAYKTDGETIECEDDADADCSVLDAFIHERGRKGILQMFRFSIVKFDHLYSHIQADAESKWTSGRERKYAFNSRDVFVM